MRPLRESDADAVAELFVRGHGEHRRMDGSEIREWLRNEAIDDANLVVLTRDGAVIAYFDLWVEEDGTVDIDLTAPGAWDETLAAAEELARERGGRTGRVLLPDGHEAESVLRSRGYGLVRVQWTMSVELGVEAPREAVVPDGIEVRPYRHPDDERAVYEAQQEAFADHWGFHPVSIEQWREFTVRAATFDPELWVLAWDGDELAGASINSAERLGDPGYGWVNTLGVRRPWRRKGVGELLLRRSFAALHARGLREVRLAVDSENTTGATRLYERCGMHVRFRANTWEREL